MQRGHLNLHERTHARTFAFFYGLRQKSKKISIYIYKKIFQLVTIPTSTKRRVKRVGRNFRAEPLSATTNERTWVRSSLFVQYFFADSGLAIDMWRVKSA